MQVAIDGAILLPAESLAILATRADKAHASISARSPVPKIHSRPLYGLAVAFAAVAIAFIAATLIAERVASPIEDDVAEMRANALPSVTHLMSARTALRHIEIEASALVSSRPSMRSSIVDRTTRMRAALGDAIAAAAATPAYPGEREVTAAKLVPAVRRFDEALARLERIAAADESDDARTAALRDLGTEADALDGVLAELAEINHAGAYGASERIARARRDATRINIVLEIASSLVAVLAAILVMRAARRHDRVLQQSAAIETARASELETFAQRVAHDLLNPLAAVTFALGEIARKHPDRPTTDAVDRARRALSRSRGMVRGIFDFARSGARPPSGTRADVRACIVAAVDDLVAVDPSAPPFVHVDAFEDCGVVCEPSMLGVILSNLLGNAWKFMQDSADKRITVRAHVGATRVRIDVEDTGPGLAPGLDQSAFEPYVRGPHDTKPGLGLGLATVKQTVLAHGGTVGVRRLPAGTLFWFELPRSPELLESADSPPRLEVAPTSDDRALN